MRFEILLLNSSGGETALYKKDNMPPIPNNQYSQVFMNGLLVNKQADFDQDGFGYRVTEGGSGIQFESLYRGQEIYVVYEVCAFRYAYHKLHQILLKNPLTKLFNRDKVSKLLDETVGSLPE